MGEINFFPDDLEIKDQKIILRLDLNVPIEDKVIKDDTRIILCCHFINKLIEKAKIIIIKPSRSTKRNGSSRIIFNTNL